jgi:hypothetical protein
MTGTGTSTGCMIIIGGGGGIGSGTNTELVTLDDDVLVSVTVLGTRSGYLVVTTVVSVCCDRPCAV